MSKDVSFSKLSGTGNDFIIVNLLESDQGLGDMQARIPWVKEICSRNFGVGADGVAFLEKESGYDFAWDFYNADGSMAEMCGNASRCVTRYMKDKKFKTKIKFKTLAGEIHGRMQGDTPEARLLTKVPEMQNKKILIDDTAIEGTFLNTGVPHFVVLKEQSQFAGFLETARKLRSHSDFGPRGTNVTLLDTKSPQPKSVSFERGVEGYTLACGTGAVAAALTMLKGFGRQELELPGGKVVVVSGEDGIWFSGEVIYICDGVYKKERVKHEKL